ncbi:motility associated factor glycosyltransferase family protein [Clostridium botulinum]|uniref:motility associated factor glycosyltransferase family protein n=1 Tax=Clostridium botulinum TaxID=1491 RepID=UPI0006A56650|nr:6-hydroxymethylpterin diphosphokinase MptE-like protein [Clostridium botulinum]KOC31905.1 hypothetical protein ADU81_12655 [Clostridium botulinum]
MIVNYNFDIEESKDGYKVLKINKDNKKVYIGSKYRMKQCIDKLISEDKEIDEESIIIIFGIGTGQYIKNIYSKFKNVKILIFEPNIRIRDYVNQSVDDYGFLKERNVYLLNGENEGEIYDELSKIIGEFDISKILYRWILNYDKVYKEEILKFSNVIRKFINDIAISRNTSMIFSNRWFDTLMCNLKYIIQSTPINLLKNKFIDVPAIIVSAGPSLSKNINELSNIKDNMMILSGGRTLRTLMEMNVKPSLIGVVDPGEVSYDLVKGYIENTDVPLLYYEGTNEIVVKRHRGNKLCFSQNDTVSNIFGMRLKNLSLGGSIAHTLTAAASYFGCNPIIFIGQDLAYTGEKYHADIAINQFKDDKDNKIRENMSFLYVEDIYGGKVRTSEVLDNFRRDLEKIIQNNKDITFINATEGGAKIKGTIQMTLKDAIKKYKIQNSIGCFEGDNELDVSKIKQSSVEILEKIIEADEKIIDKSKRALRIIKDLEIYIVTKQKSKVDRCLKQLDKIDKVIKEKYENLDILRSIIYPTIYTILSSNKPKNDKEIIERNKYLYESILNVSKEVLDPIKKTKFQIEKMEKYDD